jgi:RTX calcium-binding nonapeptide repeat (4 copies)
MRLQYRDPASSRRRASTLVVMMASVFMVFASSALAEPAPGPPPNVRPPDPGLPSPPEAQSDQLPPVPAPATPPPVMQPAAPPTEAPDLHAQGGNRGKACTITGTRRSDRLSGSAGDDVICGRGGNDVIRGGKGADTVRGDAGNDRLLGGPGADVLVGGSGNDSLYGNSGDDAFQTMDHGYVDRVFGGTGRDAVVSRNSNDILRSVEVRPRITATASFVNLYGTVYCHPGSIGVNGPSVYADGSPYSTEYVVGKVYLWVYTTSGWTYLTESDWQLPYRYVPNRSSYVDFAIPPSTQVAEFAWTVTRGYAYEITVLWYNYYQATFQREIGDFQYQTGGFEFGTPQSTWYCVA